MTEEAVVNESTPGNSSESHIAAPARLSAFGETAEQSKRRRDEQRWIFDYLRSDLYEREVETDNSVTWKSPLGWRVTFTVEPMRWTVEITKPNGDLFKRLPYCTVNDLEAVLP